MQEQNINLYTKNINDAYGKNERKCGNEEEKHSKLQDIVALGFVFIYMYVCTLPLKYNSVTALGRSPYMYVGFFKHELSIYIPVP